MSFLWSLAGCAGWCSDGRGSLSWEMLWHSNMGGWLCGSTEWRVWGEIPLLRSGTKLQTEVIQTKTCCPPLQTPTQHFYCCSQFGRESGLWNNLKTIVGADISRSSLWGYSDFTESWTKSCKMKDPRTKLNSVFLVSGCAQHQNCAAVFASEVIPTSSFPDGSPRKADTGSVHNSYQIHIWCGALCFNYLIF